MLIADNLPRSIKSYEVKLYFKDNGVPGGRDGEWVDFTSRWDDGDKRRVLHKLGPINQATEGKAGVNSFQTSAQSVTFNNTTMRETGVGFFDRPIPAISGTMYGRSYPTILITEEGNAAYFRYSRGYEQTVYLDTEVKIDLRITLQNFREVDVTLGTFLFGNMSRDSSSGLVNAGLISYSKKLQRVSAETVKDGSFWHVNKPVSFLIHELLEAVFGNPLPSDWDIPSQISIETAGSIRARVEVPEETFNLRVLSAFGRPPDYNGTLWIDLGLIPRWMEIWQDGTTEAAPTVTCDSEEDYGFFLIGNNTKWYSEVGVSARPGDSIVIRNSSNGNDGSYELDEIIKPINPGSPERLKLKVPLKGTTETSMEFSIVKIYFAVSEDIWAFNPETQIYRRVTSWSLTTIPTNPFVSVPIHVDASPRKCGHARRIWHNPNDDYLYVIATPDLLDTFEGEDLGHEIYQFGTLFKISDNMKDESDFSGSAIAGFGTRTDWQVGPLTNGNFIFHQGRGHYFDKGGDIAENSNDADMSVKMSGTVVLKFRAEDRIEDGTEPTGSSVQGFAYNDDGSIYIARGENFLLPFSQVPKYANSSPYLGKRVGFQKPDTERHWITDSGSPQYIDTLPAAYTAIPWPDVKPGLEAGINLGFYASRGWNIFATWYIPQYVSNDILDGPEPQNLGEGGTRVGELVKSGFWAFITVPLAGEDTQNGVTGAVHHFHRSMWWMFSQGQQGVTLFQSDYGTAGAIIFPKMVADYSFGSVPTESPLTRLMVWDISNPTGATALSCMDDIKTSDGDIAENYVGVYPINDGTPENHTAVEFFSYTAGCVRVGTDNIYLGLVAPTDYAYDNKPTPAGDDATKKFLWENTELWVWRSIIVEVDTNLNTRSIEWKSTDQETVADHQDEIAWTILEVAYDEVLDRLIVIGLNRRGFEGVDPASGETLRIDNRYFIGLLEITGTVTDIVIPSDNFWFIGQPQGLVKDSVSGDWYFTISGSNTLWKLTINGGNVDTLLMGDGFPTINGDGYLGTNLVLDPYTRGAANDSSGTFAGESVIVYGCSRPGGDPEVQDGLVNGKFYLWKYDRFYTTRIELADFSDMDVWQAAGAFAQLTDHLMGFDGDRFFFIQRTHLTLSDVTYSEDNSDYKLKRIVVKDGLDEVYNFVAITPFEVVYQNPEIEATVRGREEEDPAAEFEFAVNQTGIRPKRAVLRCVKSGPLNNRSEDLESARFIYKVTGGSFQRALAQAYVENDPPYKVYFSSGVGDIAPGDFLEISWEDDIGEERTSEAIVYGELNSFEGSLYLKEGFSNLPENGFEVGQEILVRKSEQFSDSMSRDQFPFENPFDQSLYPYKVWNITNEGSGNNEVYEQAHALVIHAEDVVNKRCFVYHISSGWNQFYVEGKLTFWHIKAFDEPLEAFLIIRWVDINNYVAVGIRDTGASWIIEGRQVKSGTPATTTIHTIGAGITEGEDYLLAVQADGDDYEVYFALASAGLPVLASPTGTWTPAISFGSVGRAGLGAHRGFIHWDYITFWTFEKKRQFLLNHFGKRQSYHERKNTNDDPQFGATYQFISPTGAEDYYELYHGDENQGNPSDNNPYIYVDVEDMKNARDAVVWVDFSLYNNHAPVEEVNELAVVFRDVENFSLDYRVGFCTTTGNSPISGTAGYVRISVGSTRFWTSITDDSGIDWQLDREVKYRAKIELTVGGKIGVTLWDLDDLTNDMNGIPVIFAKDNDAGEQQDPDWPFDFDGKIGIVVKQSLATPVDASNYQIGRLYGLRIYPGLKSSPNYSARYFPSEFTETLINAKYHQVGNSGLFLKITDPGFIFYMKELIKASYDRTQFESSLLDLSHFMEGDMIIIDAPGWELQQKSHSQIMHQNLPSQVIYGRREFPSLSNRFFTPRISKDIAKRLITLFSFPTYTVDVDVLLDPMLSFLSEASGRRGVYIKHNKIFAASQEFTQDGYLRKIKHNPSTGTTTFSFKALTPY